MFNEKKQEVVARWHEKASDEVLKLGRAHGIRRQVGSLADRAPALSASEVP